MPLGLTTQQVQYASLAVILGLLAVAVIVAMVVRAVLVRAVTAIVMVVLAVLVWSQRQSMLDCVDRVESAVTSPGSPNPTCTFFGRDVEVPLPTSGAPRGPGGEPAR